MSADIQADAVVVGSGINALVAAAELGRGGRRVVLVERNAAIGGFIASGERTLPGYLHDVYSSWHPLFVSGAAYGELGGDLHAAGLEYANGEDVVTASVSADGERVVVAHRDPAVTAGAFELASDRDAYLAMLDEFGSRAGTVFGALGSELGTKPALAKLGWGAVRSLGVDGLESLARDGLTSGRSWLRRRFDGWEVDALWTPWLLHSGLGPDHATGGVMIPVFAAAMHQFGLPIVKGGAGRFVDAFEQVLRRNGTVIRTGEEVQEILVEGGRTVGVRTDRGTIRATTVLASVAPGALYERLLPRVKATAAQRAEAKRYRPGRGAMQIHLALDAPVPWADARLADVPLVHLCDGSASTGVAVAQAEGGQLPSLPTVVVGQQTVLDPQRAPDGKATLWLQLQEVPTTPTGDAAGELDVSGGWADPALREGYLSRVLDRIERVAPGFRATVLASDVIAPTDLEAYNPNAIAGDPYSGSAELDQNLLWRPFPSGASHRTVVPGLWHIGASTHPGPGLGGGSGHLAAQEVLAKRRR